MQTIELDGDAISGYREADSYYILTGEENYKEVTKRLWYFNRVLWIITISFSFLTGIGFMFFIFAYIIPFVINESKQSLNQYKK
jgi:hypothetical protein